MSPRSHIKALRRELLAAESLFLIDYSGVDTRTLGRFRKGLERAGGRCAVVTVSALRGALRETALEAPLWAAARGPTMVVTGEAHRGLLRALRAGLRGGDAPTLRAGLLNGEPCDADQLAEAIDRAPAPPVDVETIEIDGEGGLVLGADALQATREALRPYLQPPPVVVTDAPLVLYAFGPERFAVLRVLWTFYGVSPKTSRSITEFPPVQLPPCEESEALLEALRGAGAEVERVASAADGWATCEVDAVNILKAAPTLSIAEGWRLVGRVFRSSHGGNGLIIAVKEGAQEPAVDCGNPLRPSVARGDGVRAVPEVLVGDGSLLSYLQASLLARELEEFAADWHGVSWGAHDVVDAVREAAWVATPAERWVVRKVGGAVGDPLIDARFEAATDWRPRVERTTSGDVLVTFYTHSALGSVRHMAHVDRYRPGCWAPVRRVAFCCAAAAGGYVH